MKGSIIHVIRDFELTHLICLVHPLENWKSDGYRWYDNGHRKSKEIGSSYYYVIITGPKIKHGERKGRYPTSTEFTKIVYQHPDFPNKVQY